MVVTRRVFDVELIYIHVALVISMGLLAYFFFFLDNLNEITISAIFVIIILMVITIFTNRNRYLGYWISDDRLILKNRAFVLIRSMILDRSNIKGVYIIDNKRWRWLRGKEGRESMVMVLKDGTQIRLDHPPKKLKSSIEGTWNIEFQKRSSVELTRMRFEGENEPDR